MITMGASSLHCCVCVSFLTLYIADQAASVQAGSLLPLSGAAACPARGVGQRFHPESAGYNHRVGKYCRISMCAI